MTSWSRWLLAALVLLNAGWMAFDGSRALLVGDYVTPQSGRHAGRLGPWSKVVRAAGIPPRSTLMKLVFVVYGAVYLALTAAFLLGVPGARAWLIVVAVLGLWYLPFGTLINVIVLVLLCLPALRGGG
jgi:hypothetical protein